MLRNEKGMRLCEAQGWGRMRLRRGKREGCFENVIHHTTILFYLKIRFHLSVEVRVAKIEGVVKVGKVEGARGKIRGRKTTFVVGLGHIGGLALGVMGRGGEGTTSADGRRSGGVALLVV